MSVYSIPRPSLSTVSKWANAGLKRYNAYEVGKLYNGPNAHTSASGLAAQLVAPDRYAAYKAYQGLGETKRWYHAPAMLFAPKWFTANQLMNRQLEHHGFLEKATAFLAPEIYNPVTAHKLLQQPRKLDILS